MCSFLGSSFIAYKLHFWFYVGFFFGSVLLLSARDEMQGLVHVKHTFCCLVTLPALRQPQALRLLLASSCPLDYNNKIILI